MPIIITVLCFTISSTLISLFFQHHAMWSITISKYRRRRDAADGLKQLNLSLTEFHSAPTPTPHLARNCLPIPLTSACQLPMYPALGVVIPQSPTMWGLGGHGGIVEVYMGGRGLSTLYSCTKYPESKNLKSTCTRETMSKVEFKMS